METGNFSFEIPVSYLFIFNGVQSLLVIRELSQVLIKYLNIEVIIEKFVQKPIFCDKLILSRLSVFKMEGI